MTIQHGCWLTIEISNMKTANDITMNFLVGQKIMYVFLCLFGIPIFRLVNYYTDKLNTFLLDGF